MGKMSAKQIVEKRQQRNDFSMLWLGDGGQ
jgi:hypothetical protein